MTLITIFQIMCVISGIGLLLTVITQWKKLVHKN